MLLTLCKGKLHRATVTQAELHYVGSITIAADLMAAAVGRGGRARSERSGS